METIDGCICTYVFHCVLVRHRCERLALLTPHEVRCNYISSTPQKNTRYIHSPILKGTLYTLTNNSNINPVSTCCLHSILSQSAPFLLSQPMGLVRDQTCRGGGGGGGGL